MFLPKRLPSKIMHNLTRRPFLFFLPFRQNNQEYLIQQQYSQRRGRVPILTCSSSNNNINNLHQQQHNSNYPTTTHPDEDLKRDHTTQDCHEKIQRKASRNMSPQSEERRPKKFERLPYPTPLRHIIAEGDRNYIGNAEGEAASYIQIKVRKPTMSRPKRTGCFSDVPGFLLYFLE